MKIRKDKDESDDTCSPMKARVTMRISQRRDAAMPLQTTFKFKTTLSDDLPRSLMSMKIHGVQIKS